MLSRVAAGVVFCSLAIAQEPALLDATRSEQPQSGVRAGFWWADYDRDGLDDAFVIGADGSARLLHNSGDGSFADVTLLSGLDGLGAASFAAWQDYDRDGAPDVFVGTQSGPGHLMRNAGDGTFQDVTQFVGLTHSGRHLAAQWFDYDLDGLVDLAVRTDAGEHLYHALPNGHFEIVDLGSVNPRPTIDLSAVADANNLIAGAGVSVSSSPNRDSDTPQGRRPVIPLRPGPATDNDGVLRARGRIVAAGPVSLPGNYSALACQSRMLDSSTGGCLGAASVPTLGLLHPLTINLNVSGAGDVGIGTTTPAAKLDVVGTARISETLTLNPSGDQALDVSTGSIYKGGALFIHTKGGGGNTAIGQEALLSVTSGANNAANGFRALRNDTTGYKNTASGALTLSSNTTGYQNTASGYRALGNNVSGSANTASGLAALGNNTTGFNNTASGRGALYFNTIGDHNTASGAEGLRYTTSGSSNTAFGSSALAFNTTGNRNIALGFAAGANLTTGNDNIAIGNSGVPAEGATIRLGTTGTHTRAFMAGIHGVTPGIAGALPVVIDSAGQLGTTTAPLDLWVDTTGDTMTGTLTLNPSGDQALNVSSGSIYKGGALFIHTKGGLRNSALGQGALSSVTTGSGNTASGYRALSSTSVGNANTAHGDRALRYNRSDNNTAVGYAAMQSNLIGSNNTAIGFAALYFNYNGSNNTAIGHSALVNNTTGSDNTAIGYRALDSNTVGALNTASGFRALLLNTSGSRNTADGNYALRYNTTGSSNTAVGSYALRINTTGTGNIALGNFAGSSLTTGDGNIAIGNPGIQGEGTTTRIGSGQTRAFIAGIRGVTTGAANAIPVLVDSNGQLGTVSSSRRFKKDIIDMGDATENLLKLRPVRFRYKQEQTMPDGSEVPMEYGLIAEEVAEIFPDLVIYGDDGKPFTVKYHILASMLLNEMKKEKAEHAQQEARHAREMEELRNEFEARLAAVEARISVATIPAATSAGGR